MQSPHGIQQDWRWVRGCLLATGHAFDDTDHPFAPPPGLSVFRIAASPILAQLLASCDP